MLMKARLAGAHKGHGLLKKKADALQMRFRMILGKIIEVRSFGKSGHVMHRKKHAQKKCKILLFWSINRFPFYNTFIRN
jgi:V-type H+-transporting ATPase subunit D